MRADPIQEDLKVFTHEAGHGTAITVLGARIIRIIGHRHAAPDGSCGRTEYLFDHLTPWQRAFVALAGRAVAEGSDVLIDRDTPDERFARELVGAEQVEILRRAVYRWSLRRDIARAVTALSAALMDAPNATLPYYPLIPEKIVYEALRSPLVARPA